MTMHNNYVIRLSIKWEILIIIILISIKVNDLISLLLLHTFLNLKWKCECHFSRLNSSSFRIFCQNTNLFKSHINDKIITLKDVYFLCFSTLKNSPFLFISFLCSFLFLFISFFPTLLILVWRTVNHISSLSLDQWGARLEKIEPNETKRENEKRVGLGLKEERSSYSCEREREKATGDGEGEARGGGTGREQGGCQATDIVPIVTGIA